MISHLPVCFVWAFLPKFRSVTVHYSQSHSHSEYTHQSITWKIELPDTPAMQVRHTNIFLLLFFACVKGHTYSPRTQIPATCEVAERADNQKVPSHGVTSAILNREARNNRSPPAGAPFNRCQGWPTTLAHTACPPLPTASPNHAWSSQGPSQEVC